MKKYSRIKASERDPNGTLLHRAEKDFEESQAEDGCHQGNAGGGEGGLGILCLVHVCSTFCGGRVSSTLAALLPAP